MQVQNQPPVVPNGPQPKASGEPPKTGGEPAKIDSHLEKIGHANGLVSRLSKSGSAGRSSLCCAHSITEALALCLFFTSHFIRSDLLISQGKRQGLAHCWPVKAID